MRPEFLEERKSKKEIGQSEKEIGQMVFCKIQLFSEKYFTGQCQGFVENFASLGYRRCTPKSAIVEDGAWTLYSNLGFQGKINNQHTNSRKNISTVVLNSRFVRPTEAFHYF